ncbi:hypothetical protein IGS61_04475 [Janthinobacterium sp. FW305-129]|uniref:hypothetical protein n=1 Tax=Janthinobacterium sp. FW305-129 TaxID=2775054 RepID=UPI001E49CAC8|nr:hypothetical protein [Janthinobacterium sp. FW305-129]MCC7596729.1 hypothetical protein [Janthinobacterium sp. FW305-129]
MNGPFPRMPLPQELAYEFIGIFARCEYALKSTDFARGGEVSVEANWDKFATSIDESFRRVPAQPFMDAVHYLLTEPPRKQVLREGRVDWNNSPPDVNLPDAQKVLLMVRRVRNNLFHGAKIWSPEYDNRERDIKLVEASLCVLKHVVELNTNVNIAFAVGAF